MHCQRQLFGVRLPGGIETTSLQTTLTEGHVHVSLRGDAIWLSPHIYTDAADLDALVETAVRGLAGSA